MSQKQLRKLRELRQEAQGVPENREAQALNEELESSDDQVIVAPQGFHALADSSSSEVEVQVPSVETKSGKARRKKRQVKTSVTVETKSEEDFFEGLDVGDAEDKIEKENESAASNPMTMRRSDFSGDAERQRLFGRVGLRESRTKKGARARGQAEGRTLHHRRLFLVSLEANEPWPKPDDTCQMVVLTEEDGAVSFDFEESVSSKRSLEILQSVVSQEDPELLQRYLQRSPFSVDGLLVMAEHHRRQGGYDQARELIRRAVYTVECALAADFSPFEGLGVGVSHARPRVRLHMRKSLEWPGWSWLRAMWMHMHCLAGQGMHRTALEVCKLLIAATLPQDPLRALLWLDHFCLRSRQYKLIGDLSVSLAETCGQACNGLNYLEFAFPNFAYSVALAGILQKSPDMSLLNHVTLEQILSTDVSDLEGDLLTLVRLMRALLYFPGGVRPLLEEAAVPLSGPSGENSWLSLLTRPPFVDFLDFRHQVLSAAQGRSMAAYGKLCGPLWKDEPVKVLHACAMRWVKLHESEIFVKDIVAARNLWATAKFAFSETLRDYEDVLPDDGLANPPVPMLLEHALSARLHPKMEAQDEGIEGFRRSETVPNMSIYTPPLILFFQSLLPWSVLDSSGVTATPVLWKDVGRAFAHALKEASLFTIEVVTQLLSSAAAMLKDLWHRATH